MNTNKVLLMAIIILLIVNLSISIRLLLNETNNDQTIIETSNTAELENRVNNAQHRYGALLLTPPPSIAISGPVITSDGDTYPIPPLNTTDIFIIAYYNCGQEINLTKAAQLQGLSISKWGYSYFDGIYYFYDPTDVPQDQTEAFTNSTLEIHVRVRSDGWVLAWIMKNQPLTEIVMSGRDIDSYMGSNNPWIASNVTTLSYTIYKILLEAGITSSDDTDGDGIPDDLVGISRGTGYYDYKYCGPAGRIGFLAVLGVRGKVSASYGSDSLSKTFDFTVGSMYELKEAITMVNSYMYLYDNDGDGTISMRLNIYMNSSTDFRHSIYHKSWYSGYGYSHKKEYKVRTIITAPFNITTGQIYYGKLDMSISTQAGSGGGLKGTIRLELYIVMIGVLK